jgi:hypothetical protein
VAAATRTALVIGAQGVLGHFVARALQAAGWRVWRGGRRFETAADFRLVDLDDPSTITAAAAGAELVITTVAHPSLAAERAVLRSGGLLLGVGALSAAGRQRLEAEADGARGLVVVHGGFVPGVTTLLVAELLAEHPEADTVETSLAFSAASSSGLAGKEFAYRLLTGARRHPTAWLPLPPPLGRRQVLDVGMAGEGWLSRLAAGRRTSLYVSLAEPGLHRGLLLANRLGLLRTIPRRAFVGRRQPRPEELSREPVCGWVAVLGAGRRLATLVAEGEGDYRTTVAATCVLAEALVARYGADGGRRGVCGPEELFTLRDLVPALEVAGVSIVAPGASR